MNIPSWFKISSLLSFLVGFSGGPGGKELPAIQETWVQPLGWEDPLEKGMTNHSSILTWSVSWTEEPIHGLQSTGSQRVRHDWATNTFTFLSCSAFRLRLLPLGHLFIVWYWLLKFLPILCFSRTSYWQILIVIMQKRLSFLPISFKFKYSFSPLLLYSTIQAYH